MKSGRIFLVLMTILGLSLTTACTEVGTKRVDLPQNIRSITDQFVSALKRGDTQKTEEHLAANYQDLPKIRFTDAQKILKDAPELSPIFFQSKPKSMMGSKDNEYTVVYAAKHKGRWKSIQMRLFALDGEPLEIEYWHAKDETTPPQVVVAADVMNKTLLYGGAFMLALTGIFIAGLIWFFKSRKKSIAADSRPVATVVQDFNSIGDVSR